jgi:glucoamylase
LWAHSEYLRLLRSCDDGKVFDLIPEVAARYRDGKEDSKVEFWLPKHPIRQARKDHTLRICAPEAFRLRWTVDDWKTWQESESHATGIGGEYFDVSPDDFHSQLDFTFFWPGRGRTAGSGKAGIIRSMRSSENAIAEFNSRECPSRSPARL